MSLHHLPARFCFNCALKAALICLLLITNGCSIINFKPIDNDLNFKPNSPVIFGKISIFIDAYYTKGRTLVLNDPIFQRQYSDEMEKCNVSTSPRVHSKNLYSYAPIPSWLGFKYPVLNENGLFIANFNNLKNQKINLSEIQCLAKGRNVVEGYSSNSYFSNLNLEIGEINANSEKSIYIGDIKIFARIVSVYNYEMQKKKLYKYKIYKVEITNNILETTKEVNQLMNKQYPDLKININDPKFQPAIY